MALRLQALHADGDAQRHGDHRTAPGNHLLERDPMNQQENQKGHYKCGRCSATFETQNELRQHEEQKHASPQNKVEEPQKTRGAGGR